jgi:RNase P/RNase MRP subunit POP5
VRIEEKTFQESGLCNLVIPSSVEVLGPRCFYKCMSLVSITFESTSRLIEIEKEAFYESGLRTIIIPSSVQILGDKSFASCARLQKVTFDRKSRLRQIGRDVFKGCAVSPVLPKKGCLIA